MKFIIILFALMAAISAMPHHRHDHGANNNNNNDPAAATPQATTTRVAPQGNRGGNQGNRNGDPGNQGGRNTAQPPAQTTTAAAVGQPPATTAQGGGQPTNTALAGQNGNTGQATPDGSINPALVPDFGQKAGLQPDGTGNCKSDAGKTIPCQCPPDRNAFIAKLEEFVQAGSFFGTLDAPFPTGNSNGDALTRIDTIISTLQNFAGSPGKGCPSVSAPNFGVVQQNLIKGGA